MTTFVIAKQIANAATLVIVLVAAAYFTPKSLWPQYQGITCLNLQSMNELVVCCLPAFGSTRQLVPARQPTYV